MNPYSSPVKRKGRPPLPDGSPDPRGAAGEAETLMQTPPRLVRGDSASAASAQSEGSAASKVSVLATGIVVPSPGDRSDVHPNALDQQPSTVLLFEGDRGGDGGGDHISVSESESHHEAAIVTTNLGGGLLAPTGETVESVDYYNNHYVAAAGGVAGVAAVAAVAAAGSPSGIDDSPTSVSSVPVGPAAAVLYSSDEAATAGSVDTGEWSAMEGAASLEPATTMVLAAPVATDHDEETPMIPPVDLFGASGGGGGADGDTLGAGGIGDPLIAAGGAASAGTRAMDADAAEQAPSKRRLYIALLVLFVLTLVSFSIAFGVTDADRNGDGSGIIIPPMGPTTAPTTLLRPTSQPTMRSDPTASPRPVAEATSPPSQSPTSETLPPVSTTGAPIGISLSPTAASSARPTLRPSGPPGSIVTTAPTPSPASTTTSTPTTVPASTTTTPTMALPMTPTLVPTTMAPTVFQTAVPSPITMSATPVTQSPTIPNQMLFNFLAESSFDGGEALSDPDSPQFAAFEWLAGNAELATYSPERVIQRYGLSTLFYSTGGSEWSNSELWLSDEDECDWYSRARDPCAGPGREFKRLELYYNNLRGELPPEIALLSNQLERIDISGGPAQALTGTLPSEYGLLEKLEEFRLHDNDLSGSIPPEYTAWSNLDLVDLSGNRLSSTLPTDIGEWRKVKTLNFARNMLTGPLPPSIGGLQSLKRLDLDDNEFTGPIPSAIGGLQKLENLNIRSNQLTALPTDIGSCRQLRFINLEGNALGGALPSEVGQLNKLIGFSVQRNTFVGQIPTQLGNLRGLRESLDLSENQFTGTIPSELGLIRGKLRMLLLRDNKLTGMVPSELELLDKLNVLALDTNDLTGSMPVEVCSVFNETLATISIDCEEVNCPCCNYCCQDGEGCQCRYLGTELEYLCFF